MDLGFQFLHISVAFFISLYSFATQGNTRVPDLIKYEYLKEKDNYNNIYFYVISPAPFLDDAIRVQIIFTKVASKVQGNAVL